MSEIFSLLDLVKQVDENRKRQAKDEADRRARIEASERAKLLKVFTPVDILKQQKQRGSK